MREPITLRPAARTEAAAVLAVIHAGFGQYRGLLVPESSAFKETVDSVRGTIEIGGAVVAETADGRMVGTVLFQPEGDALYLGRLAVLPEARGQGVAARLVEEVVRAAERRGCAAVTLGVRLALADNIRLFTRLGFVETGRTCHPGFAEHTSMDMAKRLR